MSLSTATRRRVEQFVRPLYAGLDGEETFHRVDRMWARIEAIRGEADLDRELLELLVLFHGVVPRLGSLARNGRVDLFLRGLDLGEEMSLRVRAGLKRLATAPSEPEELVVHDAVLLEESGVTAAARRLLAAGRRRVSLVRAVERLDAGPPVERFRTPKGSELAAARRRQAMEWIENLGRSVEAEEGLR